MQATQQHGNIPTLQQRNDQLDSQIKQLTSQVTQLKTNESLLSKENRELKQQKTIAQDSHNQVRLSVFA